MSQEYTVIQYTRAVRLLRDCENDYVHEVGGKNKLIRCYLLAPVRQTMAEQIVLNDALRTENQKLKQKLKRIAMSASDAVNG